MIFFLAIICAVVGVVGVLLPFVVGEGGTLASASAQNSPQVLRDAKATLVNRFVRDELAFNNGQMPERAWKARKNFLLRRYLDAARRLDFVLHEDDESKGKLP